MTWTWHLPAAGLLCLPVLAFANPLPDDQHFGLRYSQYNWQESSGDGVGPTRDEWVQAMQVTIRTGYLTDRFGIDVGAGVANDISVGSDADSITNLRPDTSVQDPHGIAGMTTLYGRVKLHESDSQRLVAGYGKATRHRRQYLDNRTRILPAASLGADIDFQMGGHQLYASQIERFSRRDSSRFATPLLTFAGEEIEHLRIAGADFALSDATRLALEYAEANDYLGSALAELSHRLPLGGEQHLQLLARHGRQWDAGELFEYQGAGPYAPSEDHDAQYIDLGITWHDGGHYLGINANHVSGDDYDRLFFADDHGHWESSAKNFYWFGLEDETMVKLRAGVDLGAWMLTGLRWDGHYAVSDHARGYDDFARHEFQSVLSYRFQDWLKGLSIAWLHTEFATDGKPDGEERQSLVFTPAGFITHDADRFYLSYTHEF